MRTPKTISLPAYRHIEDSKTKNTVQQIIRLLGENHEKYYEDIRTKSVPIADGDTTPDVSSANAFKTANTGSTTITDFDYGSAGQTIFILFNDSNTVISQSGNISLSKDGSYSPVSGDYLVLSSDGTTWTEVTRSNTESALDYSTALLMRRQIQTDFIRMTDAAAAYESFDKSWIDVLSDSTGIDAANSFAYTYRGTPNFDITKSSDLEIDYMEYATDGAAQAAYVTNAILTGDGHDGALTVTTTVKADGTKHALSSNAASGQKDVVVSDSSGYVAGDKVLLVNMQGTGGNQGKWEIGEVASQSSGTITLVDNLTNNYTTADKGIVQIVPQYSSITVQSGGILTADAWNGTVGGIVAFMCSGTVTVDSGGKITAKGLGYRGGAAGDAGTSYIGTQGESHNATGAVSTAANNGGGGGGDSLSGTVEAGGGGGGYGVAGGNGAAEGAGTGGTGGGTYGQADLNTTMYFGSGGGGGYVASRDGGAGGGVVAIYANELTVAGAIDCDGDDGVNNGSNGGGSGAGGSIYLSGSTITLGTGLTHSSGGSYSATYKGGDGGAGRIEVRADTKTGTTVPTYGDGGAPEAGDDLQSYSEGTIKQQGSYSLKASAAQTLSLNKTLTKSSLSIDLSNRDDLTIDCRASRTGSQFKIGLHDSGGTTTEHTVNIAVANTWQTETIDLSAVSNANKDAIDSIIITITNADSANTIYLDDFKDDLGAQVQSIDFTVSAEPDTILVMWEENLGTGTVTFYISRDGGTTWTEATSPSSYTSPVGTAKYKLVDVSAQPSGTTLKLKSSITGDAQLESWAMSA
jgi:hypothetical protein